MEQVFQDYVLAEKARGKGVFLSSHIMSEVERLCDRVGIIREGELVEVGTPSGMRHLTRYFVKVVTERAIEGLDAFDGVFDIAKDGEYLTFKIDSGNMGPVIEHLGKFGVSRLQSAPPTLEDLFMQHYKGGE
jgi:ABC-2 type transport system ATP-binding protein